ncbi:MAG TPA: hypothetical protein VI094_04685 [Propionibacteriaceae bacterium]
MSERVVTPGAKEQLAAIASLSRALDHESIDIGSSAGGPLTSWSVG